MLKGLISNVFIVSPTPISRRRPTRPCLGAPATRASGLARATPKSSQATEDPTPWFSIMVAVE